MSWEQTLVSLTSAAATGIRGNWMRGVHLQRRRPSSGRRSRVVAHMFQPSVRQCWCMLDAKQQAAGHERWRRGVATSQVTFSVGVHFIVSLGLRVRVKVQVRIQIGHRPSAGFDESGGGDRSGAGRGLCGGDGYDSICERQRPRQGLRARKLLASLLPITSHASN